MTNPADPANFAQQHPKIEEELLGIWHECLERKDFGIDANFFAVGGDSVTATSVLVRIREVFNVALPLRAIFENPSIRGLTQAIEEAALHGTDNLSEEELMDFLPDEGRP